MPAGKPHVIYINSHDTGRYISPYGHRVRTPHLQALAGEGVLFRQAFDAAPTCSSSRASLCTGQYPHVCGMVGLGNRGIYPFDFSHHMAHTFKGAGYETVAWGMQDNHMGVRNAGGDHTTLGYETFLKGWSADNIISFLKGPHERPFFLSISYILTHRRGRGFTTDRKPVDDPRYVIPPATLGDTAKIREDWAHQLSDIETLDEEMGKVFDALDEAGLKDDTIVIATTDHGVAFPGMKCNLTVHGTGVFLIMRGPGGLEGGTVVDGMASHVDVFPTICELTGIAPPDWLDGTSMMPLVRGEKEQIHDGIFTEVSYHAVYEPMRSLRTPRYAYVKRFGGRRKPVLPNIDGSLSKDEWLARGYADRELPEEMLFDTFFDPQEMNDLARDPAHRGTLEELRGRLEAWMKETDDPLLAGKVPMPETGWENPADDVDPTDRRSEEPAPRRTQ